MSYRAGNFYNGTLFAEDGTKLKDVVPTKTSDDATTKKSSTSETDAAADDAKIDHDAETDD